ncbi:hypothetical protein [Hydrogenophaga sp. BPS33]|uniref:hypothetical protein n=1 Tax=Hydrogenophaga sp. BPS33 TaxID=2651974 RepID=UPI00131F803E|nr:hypothetical protein [Hydrogenophaga sp. BPS33]QHE84751.1 hypothetical protein F9K07_07575 [Hydrogenophaga sp. BPS33]
MNATDKRAMVRNTLRTLANAVAVTAALVTGAAAQSYPSKRLTIIVPYAPGGQFDFVGRKLAQLLSSTDL